MIIESQQIKSDLAHEIQVLHGDVEKGSTEMGKIYRAWMEVKAVFTGENRHTILSNCEAGEDAVQKAYRKALETGPTSCFFAGAFDQSAGNCSGIHIMKSGI